MEDSNVEVLPPGYKVPPASNAVALPTAANTPITKPCVTYPAVPRLPMHDNAIALVRGEPGSAWSVLRDVMETTSVLIIAMYLVGDKDRVLVLKSALAGAILVESAMIAYTAAALRTAERGTEQ